ncbi:cytochrome P450 CYP736A12-like [Punica granatum]|uniref:Cytochrome P450 CYP736A12-like n=2 Tax=Punica granatum TaxID=22663 RepID=A0A6P8BN90_PUNGR|nr:cytochrome P450 CYP736A12-like [Punica granatum]
MDLYTSVATLFAILGALQLLLHYFWRARKLPPGPWPLPVIGNLHMLGKLPHQSLRKLAKTYGPIMSIHLGTVPAIVASSREAAELFLKTHDRAFAGRPKTLAIEHVFYSGKGIAFTDYGPYWQNVRKLCISQLFSPSKIDRFGAMRKEGLCHIVRKIKEAAVADQVVDVSALVEELIGDMSFRMILGSSFKDRSNLKAIIHEGLRLAGTFNLADYVPLFRAFDLQGITQRSKEIHVSIDKVLEEIIDEHERNDVESESVGVFVDVLLSMMNQSLDTDNNKLTVSLNRTNLKAILLDMITGSYESSSIAINWAFSELLRNPHVMAQLQEELNTVVGMDRMVEEADLMKLNYLEMVVKETLRLHPVEPLLLPHECKEDTVINGYHIPKKSRIIVNVGAIGRDPKIWSGNAEEFIPERFIDNDIDLKGHDFQLIPFGSGRRICPGMVLGLINVQLVAAQLVHCFKWELPHGMLPCELDMTEEYGMSCSRANHLLLKPTYRLLV